MKLEIMDPNEITITDLIESSDFEAIRSFHQTMNMLTLTMTFFQLLCEGHNRFMQSYLRFQGDNSVSFDVLQQTCLLVMKLSKTDETLDVMCEPESQLLMHGLELLTELMQGPCPENQEQVS